MVIRPGGGSNGAGMMHYLETGEKVGREHTRDELDQRIILEGDLGETARIIDDMTTATPDTERFLHLSFGFKEDHISPEMYAAINADIKEFLLGAYEPGEMNYYAEAHDPRIKTEIDSHGEVQERKPHIHVIIPKINQLTGKKDDPLGMMSARYGGKYTTVEILDAFQEHINNKYGLISPKDLESRRIDFTSKTDILSRIDGHDFTGMNREWLQTIRDRMVAEKIETPEAFKAMLRTIGAVAIAKAGHHDEYLKVKPIGEQKHVRLDYWQFSNEFITMPTADKEAFIHQERVRRYMESNPGRPTPEKIKEVLDVWEQRKYEIRFLHTDMKVYKEKYKGATAEEKMAVLEQLKSNYYSKVKNEFGLTDSEIFSKEFVAEQSKFEDALDAEILEAFPNRRLNSTHYRTLEEIREAIEAGEAIIADPQTVIDELTFSQSTITERDLEKYLLKHTADDEQYNLAMEAVLAIPSLVIRQDEKGHTTFTTEAIAKIEKELVATVERMAGARFTPSRAEIDAKLASSEYKAKEKQRNSLAAMLPIRLTKIFKSVVHAVFGTDGNIHDSPSLDDVESLHESEIEKIAREIASGKSMNEGQLAAYNLLCSDRQIAVVNGAAGTGKSYILSAMREAYEATGHTVYGAILQGKTAEDLERDSGITSTTMHSFLSKLNKGIIKLNDKSVVVVDEAGMIGSGQMQAILRHVENAGAKIRLVGDVKQLAAVEYGRAFKEVSDRCKVASLTQIMRQKEAWQRAASEQLAEHKIADPLRAYNDNGNIHFEENAKAAQVAIVSKWAAYRTANSKEDLIVLVHTNVERKQLNALMRAEIKKQGGLKNESDVNTADGILKMAVGEQVMFTRGDKELGVKNGTSGMIEKIKDGMITVRLDNGKTAVFNAEGTKDMPNNLTYAYACTVHKSQGMTKHRGLILANPNMSLENLYVAMTRHKISLDIFCNKKTFLDVDILIAKMDKTGRKDFSYDASKPEWETTRANDSVVSQYKTDFAADKVIERAAKSSTFTELRDNLDARQLLERLAKSHGVDLSIYGIIKDKEGIDRIACGKRHLNVSDFLTKEMHLDFKTVAFPILKETYAAQLELTYAPRRETGALIATETPAAHEVSEPLWKRFQIYKATQAATYKELASALTEEARTRRASTISEEHKHRILIKKEGIPTPKMRNKLSEIRSLRDLALNALSQEISDRRGKLMREYKQPQAAQYKNYLEVQALAGEEQAFLEFQRVAITLDDKKRLAAIETARAAKLERLRSKIEIGIADAALRTQQANMDVISEAQINTSIETTAVIEAENAAISFDSPANLLADIKQQATVYRQGHVKHGSKSIMLADTTSNKLLSGAIICANDEFVTAIQDNKLLIHKKELLTNIEYDGKAEGHERFSPGSTLEVQYRNDGTVKVKITEKRIQFKSPDRHDSHEHPGLS